MRQLIPELVDGPLPEQLLREEAKEDGAQEQEREKEPLQQRVRKRRDPPAALPKKKKRKPERVPAGPSGPRQSKRLAAKRKEKARQERGSFSFNREASPEPDRESGSSSE